MSLNLDELKQQVENLVNSTGDFASYILEKSSEYLPNTDKIVEPIKTKANEIQKTLKTKTENVCTLHPSSFLFLTRSILAEKSSR